MTQDPSGRRNGEDVGEAPGRPQTRAALERVIGHDLAVPGLRPRLHLPILAGLAQGPGFPNRSCLGLLADRVLGAYVEVGAHEHVKTAARWRHKGGVA